MEISKSQQTAQTSQPKTPRIKIHVSSPNQKETTIAGETIDLKTIRKSAPAIAVRLDPYDTNQDGILDLSDFKAKPTETVHIDLTTERPSFLSGSPAPLIQEDSPEELPTAIEKPAPLQTENPPVKPVSDKVYINLSQQTPELKWALELLARLRQGYQPSPSETELYQQIISKYRIPEQNP